MPKPRLPCSFFQRRNGLAADGIVGAATARAMGVSLKGTSSSAGTTNSDLYLMSCCIYGEARGESYTGKVAVAAVILNRVKSASFPNSISGVIYQKAPLPAWTTGR